MCGIVVTIGKHSDKKVQYCLDKIKHRGPDSYNIITFDNNNIGIGFVRLAINDTAIKDNQPFEFDDLIGVFNAEIYNYHHLIKKYNLDVKSNCDTEIILPLFKKIGIKILSEMDGFFSGVIINKLTKEIIFIKDYIGKKPLFFAYDENTKYIVSEIKSLPKINNFSTVPKGISSLKDNSFELICKHSSIKYPKSNIDKELEKAFYVAIDKRIRNIKNMKFGIFLSGGLDSSIVASLVNKSKFAHNVHYYYLASQKHEDYKYIQLIKKYLNISQNEITKVSFPSEEELPSIIDKLVYVTQSYNPSIISNGIGSYLLSKQANKDGIKVVLTGDGADEMFLGYDNSNELSKKDLWQNKRFEFLNDLSFTELRRIDLTCMSNSVEVRCPFLDEKIFNITNNMSYEYFFGYTKDSLNKNILRKIFAKILPKEIINRKKISFDVGSGLQKIMVKLCKNKNIDEKTYLKKIWNNHFSKNLSLIANDIYFFSYPQFDDVIKTRGNKYAK